MIIWEREKEQEHKLGAEGEVGFLLNEQGAWCGILILESWYGQNEGRHLTDWATQAP